MNKIKNFQDLEIWQVGKNLSVSIYQITNKNKFQRDFGLRDQIRKAIVSIPSNIAEGFNRRNNNELIQFLRIAKGSCAETITQLIIAKEIGYLSDIEYDGILAKLNILNDKIGKFINYLRAKRKNKEFQNN